MTTGETSAEPAVRADVGSGEWLAQELQRALARVEELAQDLARLQAALSSQQAEMARLQETLAVVTGCTQRHETGQEAARALQQETAALAERIEQEAALRRDLAASVERETQREREERQTARQQLEQLSSHLEQLQQQFASDDERRRRVAADIGRWERREQTLDARVAELERRAVAEREALDGAREEQARTGAALPGLLSAVDELAERARSAQEERSRLEDGVAAVGAERERESELLEVIEQQRAARQRMEERLTALDEALEETRRNLAAAAEERSMVRQQVAGNQQRLRELAETLEGQRTAIIEHFRRWIDSGVESGRRQVQEIERANRVARDLLVRLTERSEEAGQEQPL